MPTPNGAVKSNPLEQILPSPTAIGARYGVNPSVLTVLNEVTWRNSPVTGDWRDGLAGFLSVFTGGDVVRNLPKEVLIG